MKTFANTFRAPQPRGHNSTTMVVGELHRMRLNVIEKGVRKGLRKGVRKGVRKGGRNDNIVK